MDLAPYTANLDDFLATGEWRGDTRSFDDAARAQLPCT